MKLFADFSENNVDVDWDAFKQSSGMDSVGFKVSEGETLQDKMFAVRFNAAAKRNIPVEVLYLFHHPSDDPNAEADLYIKTREAVTRDKTIPAGIDLETGKNPAEWANTPQSKLYSDLQTLIARLVAEGYTVIIYSYPAFLEQYFPDADFLVVHDLWVAWYEPGPPKLPRPWTSWWGWQYTGTGQLPGVTGPVDISYLSAAQTA